MGISWWGSADPLAAARRAPAICPFRERNVATKYRQQKSAQGSAERARAVQDAEPSTHCRPWDMWGAIPSHGEQSLPETLPQRTFPPSTP